MTQVGLLYSNGESHAVREDAKSAELIFSENPTDASCLRAAAASKQTLQIVFFTIMHQRPG